MATGQKRKPWLQGVVDTLVGAGYLSRTAIPHRNRLVVILLDSALETGCRAYLKHECGIKLEDVHRNRDKLMKVAKSKLATIDEDVWGSLDFYYDEIRNDFYHESSAKTLTDEAIADYSETVYFVLDRAFGVRFNDLVESALSSAEAPRAADDYAAPAVEWSRLASKTERLLAAVSVLSPRGVEEVNMYFRKEGIPLRLTAREFTNIVARNSGSKNLFYYDKEQKRWSVSGLGRFRLGSLLRS